MPERLRRLEHLAAVLGDALTVDDIARLGLEEALGITGVTRAGLALNEGAGRELRFVSSDSEALSPLGVRWCTIDGLDDVPVVQAVRTGEPVYLASMAEIEAQFPGLVVRQRRLGTESMVAIPLMVDGRCVGGLLLSYETKLDLGPEQHAFLAAFAAQVAQAVRRGLAYQVQYSNSEQLQRSLMPHSLPEVNGLNIGAHYQPGSANVDVGGDWYDVLHLANGSVVLTLGDVMGKGVPAATVMSEVRSATRAYALLDPDPAVVLARLNQVIAYLPVPDQVVTMFYGLVDADRTTFTYGVAGHPPPLKISPSGRPAVLDADIGPALGVSPWMSWTSNQVSLRDGMTVLAYSDGLVESRRQDLFAGIDRLRDRVAELAPRRRNPRELCARLSDLMESQHAEDDVTMLAVTAAPEQTRASHELPGDPTAAGEARRFVAGVLREWGIDEDCVDTAELCVSELVTNAVIHSGTTSTVTVQADPEYLLVLVQDRGGRGAVRLPDELDPESVSGRGLSLVDALASAWSAEHSTDGTTVWFELALSGESLDVSA
jgi:serine phosphatase RsbU (regulator of sigma subunit)/anti-sigma regulatory factor (Ser/Thr protein kinase)